MREILSYLLATLFSIALFAQTPVGPGDISGTWTKAGQPYLIMGETTIPDGQTLLIEPGVKVVWQNDSCPMWVYGRILAVGENYDSIIFTAADTNAGWKSIRFDGTLSSNDTSKFKYCLFEHGDVYGDSPDCCGGAIAASDFDKIIIDHCCFVDNKAMDNSIDSIPFGGAIALQNSSPVIMNSLFKDNKSVYGGAISCYLNSSPDIINNVFQNNYAERGGGAIAMYFYCYPNIRYNLIYQNNAGWGGGLVVQYSSYPEIINNTIVENLANHGGGIHYWDTVHPVIRNTILWENDAYLSGNQMYIATSAAIIDIYYCDIEGGVTAFGGHPFIGDTTGIIDADPEFYDPENDDYHLVADISPCIDAGDPDPIYNDPDGTRNDIGGLWPPIPLIGIYENGDDIVIVYPNPISVVSIVEYRLKKDEIVGLSILDIYGKEVISWEDEMQTHGKHQVRFDASNLPAGIYLVRLKMGDDLVTEKIVKL